MRTDLLERKNDILQWISENRSKAYMAKELGCNPKTINSLLQRLNIQYNGNQSGKGCVKKHQQMSLVDYLEKSKDIQSNKIRIKLLQEGLKEHRCECCGLTTWLNKPIPLELHHKDGDKNHNEFDNYALLCPNCHAFTDTYRGKNCKK